MPKKKKLNPFLSLLTILFIIYISLNIASTNGYYESKINDEVVLTEKNIKKFENDIKNNKKIDLNNYVVKDKKDYRGFASDVGENFSNFVENLMTKELWKAGKVLKRMFSN